MKLKIDLNTFLSCQMQELNILIIFQVSYLIVDEADREMEIVSDPFLDAGIDIPKELPYVKATPKVSRKPRKL